jgi:hypothetical protein
VRLREVPDRAWQKISVGAEAHGPREYYWARLPTDPGPLPRDCHWREALAPA